MKVTKLEMEVLDDIANCDFSSDGNGLHSPTYQLNFNLPMSQVRALLSTLSQKGIVSVTSAEDMGETFGWVRIKDEYAVEASSLDPDLIKGTGYKLVNLED
jgi:hypothetical protein